MHDIPLGKETGYSFNYDASLLAPIERAMGRKSLSIDPSIFFGKDIWNAYEISWLNEKGLPQVKVAKLVVPYHSPCIVESKSLKLYFNSFNQSTFASTEQVEALMQQDISRCVGAQVELLLQDVEHAQHFAIDAFAAECLDHQDITIDVYQTDPSLLIATNSMVEKRRVYSNLLRSLCPVTSQPDWASVYIEYSGQAIDEASLLRYIVSFRNQQDFHELCVETIFSHLWQRFDLKELTVYARYLRRGGIDISPLRSSRDIELPDWRQLRQ